MNKNFIATVLIAVSIIVGFVFVLPKYDELSVMRDTLEARRVLLADTQASEKNIQALGREYNSHEAGIKKILLALPRQRQVDYITSSIKEAANANGIQLHSLAFSDTEKIAGNENTVEYQTIPVHAEFSGTYQELMHFLDTLESSLRLYDIAALSVSKGANGGELSIKMELSAYSLK